MTCPDPEQVTDFARDGVVLLEGVFGDWIELLREGVEANMRDPGPFGRDYLGDGEGSSTEIDFH